MKNGRSRYRFLFVDVADRLIREGFVEGVVSFPALGDLHLDGRVVAIERWGPLVRFAP